MTHFPSDVLALTHVENILKEMQQDSDMYYAEMITEELNGGFFLQSRQCHARCIRDMKGNNAEGISHMLIDT